MRAEHVIALALLCLVLGFLLGEGYGRRQERWVRDRMRRIYATRGWDRRPW